MPSRTRCELKKVGWSSILVATLLLTVAVIAEAQQLGKVHRIGFLLSISRSSMSTRIDSFRQRLRELGYVEGQDIAIEYRSAEGKLDRLPDLAVELVGPKVDVLVSGGGNSATRALMQATTLIPIVMTFGSDPVAAGFVSSLARPGGNVTGLTSITGELSGKRATKNRLPTMFTESERIETGGLMSYGPNYADSFRRAAVFVDKILKGAKPADLPVEQPAKFELAINLKTAKEISVTIPQKVLARADRVIK